MGLQRPRVHVVRPVVSLLLEPDQAEVLRAVRERLAPPTVVAVMAIEEEVGHTIVTTAKEVVKAGFATMAQEDEARVVIVAKEFNKPRFTTLV